MKPKKLRPRNVEEDRAAQLARIDVSTLSPEELDMIEFYRYSSVKVRAALFTLMRHCEGSAFGVDNKGGA